MFLLTFSSNELVRPMRRAQRKNIRSFRVESRQSIRKAQPTAFGQFSGRSQRENRRACTSQSAKCIESRPVMERHWRNKRTGADDWPITRWPIYLWYWLTIECLFNRKRQTRRHLAHLPLLLPLSRPSSDPLSFALCYYLILYLSYLPPISPACHAMVLLSRFPARRNWIYGFIFFLCGHNVHRQIARRKSTAPLLRRNNGVHSPRRVVIEKP